MRALRPATLLPRLGLAGAGLIATAIVFAAAGGLVAFGLWPEQGQKASEQRLVLPDAGAQAAPGQRPSSRPGTPSTAQRQRAVAASAGALDNIAQSAPELTIPEQTDPGTPDTQVPPRPEPVTPRPASAQPARPLEPVADTVGETTTALATSLRHSAATLAHALAAISPAAAPAVTDAGGSLAETVDEAGRAVRGILGGPRD
jgi:hypothetical protein